MSVVSSELKSYRSQTVSDASGNGGLMSDVEVVSGVSANLFSNASSTDRANGATQYRKLFFKCANNDGLALINPRIWQDTNTEGQDRVVFFPGSQRNTQGAITGVEPLYGMGELSVGVLSGVQTIVVEVEDGPTTIFRNGDLVRLSDKETPFASGNEVWLRIDDAPSVAGNLITLHFSSPLPVGFLSGAKVSSVYEAATLEPSFAGLSVSSLAGTINSSWEDYVSVNGIGTVEQNWQITFTSPTAFDVTGDTLGEVGSGNVSSVCSPAHPGLSRPYFTLSAGLFGGTFVEGDTATFTTHPAATAIWLRRTIPIGTAAQSNNLVFVYIDGEAT